MGVGGEEGICTAFLGSFCYIFVSESYNRRYWTMTLIIITWVQLSITIHHQLSPDWKLKKFRPARAMRGCGRRIKQYWSLDVFRARKQYYFQNLYKKYWCLYIINIRRHAPARNTTGQSRSCEMSRIFPLLLVQIWIFNFKCERILDNLIY